MGVQNLVNHTLLKAEVPREEMREKQLGKGQVFAEHAQHTQPIQPLDRSLTHRGCGGRMRLSLEASFAKKTACSQNSYNGLFAELGSDGELDPAFPDVEDGIRKGRVKLTVASKLGKQAVIGVLGAGSFFGEGCLKGQPHAATATAVGKASIERLDRLSMLRVLSENLAFSELFLSHLLSRNLSLEEGMVYQILNSHEKRLARALLMLANFGKKGRPKSIIPKVSFEALAELVGTSISRVGFFMRKFRKLGFIDYNGELKINNSLLNVVLHDQFVTMATDPLPVAVSPHRTLRRKIKA